MTIDEIIEDVTRQTAELLTPGEAARVVLQGLTVQGGISPEDIARVTVALEGSELKVAFHLAPRPERILIDLGDK